MDIGIGLPAVRGSGACFPKIPALKLEGGVVEVEGEGIEPDLQ